MQVPYTDPKVEGTTWTADSRAVATEHIQEQIKAHESIIRYYKSRHNALTAICQVPPEILGIIFGEAVKLAGKVNYNDPWNHGEKFRQARNVSHVCSHWRDVALYTPKLWSDIPLDYPECVEEMLQRSKMALLTIAYRPLSRFRSPPKPVYSLIALKEMFSSHLPRIGNLTLNNLTQPFLEYLNFKITDVLVLLDQPAPMMERLELRFRHYPDGKGPEQNLKLPDAIFRGLPRLESLILEGCGMPWDLSTCGNLKSLNISNIPASFEPSMTQLLGILSQTPLLEKLSLSLNNIERSTRPGDPLPARYSTPIDLLHLEDVTISTSLLDTVFLFDHLVFSRNARSFNIRVNLSHPLDKPHSLAVERLVQAIEKCVEGCIIRLRLYDGIQFWKSRGSQMPADPSFLLCGSPAIHITFSNSYTLIGKLGVDFWQSFRLDKLVALDVRLDWLTTNTLWQFIGDLPRLQDLCVGYYEGSFFEALRRYPSFAALQSLTIDGWDLDEIQTTSPGVRLVKKVAGCFKLRQEAGLGLKVLKVEHCSSVDESKLSELEEYIETVKWDGSPDEDMGSVDSYDSDDDYYDSGVNEDPYHSF
ncbi:hypothetical protein DXG01_003182 [Tephrocybe rancida]|nr:hypothetical protein DXG01_003182 [Tephrocybe rancida]